MAEFRKEDFSTHPDELSMLDIVREQDSKIRSFLDGERPQQFWHAYCPMEGSSEEQTKHLHTLGFDNYPLAQIPAIDALWPHLFFFERMLGAEVEGIDGHTGDFFHTWCCPLIKEAADIPKLNTNLDASPLWLSYRAAIDGYLSRVPVEQRLPIAFPSLGPLDTACNLCGAELFFILLYEEPKAVERLLDAIVSLQTEAYRRTKALGARIVSPYGFPGVYCSDLQLPSLSPSHVAGVMLPRYERIARECDGLLMALLTQDTDILRSALAIDGLIGCSFDKRLPLSAIREHLGKKLFFIPNYCYDDTLDRPTCRDGIWWNPIVQSYSRELGDVYREFAGRHSLLITIERPTLAEVLSVRSLLEKGTP